MSNKKHIDRVFQESFKDFEATPNPELWSEIQKDLQSDTNKPKTFFPFWLRVASIAAVLVLLITIGSIVIDNHDTPNSPEYKTVESPSKKNLNNKETNNTPLNKKAFTNSPIAEENVSNPNVSSTANTSFASENNTSEAITSQSSSLLKTDDNSSEVSEKSSNQSVANHASQPNTNAISNTSKTGEKISKNTVSKNLATSNMAVADNTNQESSASQGLPVTESPTTTNTQTTKGRIATNSNNRNSQNTLLQTNPNLDEATTQNELEKKPITSAIALEAKPRINPLNEKEKEETLIVGDSLKIESPSIEDAIAEAEDFTEKEEEKLVNRWQIYANIAPVYYNSLGNGSHIDEQFVSNSKSGETNTSYGVNVSYALSKKLAIRSGVSALNLSYDTDNVILYEAPTGNTSNPINPLRNIELASGNETLTAFSAENLGVQQISNELYKAAISQRLSYYEVPVELEYKLLDKRFGINVIGGMSTFFLNDNEVYSEFEEYTTYIGEANNINSVSFSTNLGIGMNYKFTEALKFNLEPTFKYQLNGFENTSGNFRPYIIGVYTGFSYRF